MFKIYNDKSTQQLLRVGVYKCIYYYYCIIHRDSLEFYRCAAAVKVCNVYRYVYVTRAWLAAAEQILTDGEYIIIIIITLHEQISFFRPNPRQILYTHTTGTYTHIKRTTRTYKLYV